MDNEHPYAARWPTTAAEVTIIYDRTAHIYNHAGLRCIYYIMLHYRSGHLLVAYYALRRAIENRHFMPWVASCAKTFNKIYSRADLHAVLFWEFIRDLNIDLPAELDDIKKGMLKALKYGTSFDAEVVEALDEMEQEAT